MQNKQSSTMMNMTKEKIKSFFLMAQELEAAAEEEENFLDLITEVETELDSEEDYLLCDVVSFVNDLDSAIKDGYKSIIDYWEDF